MAQSIMHSCHNATLPECLPDITNGAPSHTGLAAQRHVGAGIAIISIAASLQACYMAAVLAWRPYAYTPLNFIDPLFSCCEIAKFALSLAAFRQKMHLPVQAASAPAGMSLSNVDGVNVLGSALQATQERLSAMSGVERALTIAHWAQIAAAMLLAIFVVARRVVATGRLVKACRKAQEAKGKAGAVLAGGKAEAVGEKTEVAEEKVNAEEAPLAEAGPQQA
jgi:hypothetical protein